MRQTEVLGIRPVQAVREPSVLKALGVLAAALLYTALAKWTFDRGVRCYASGNRMLGLR
jgi:hypothetical protein